MSELNNSKIWNKNAFENIWEMLDYCKNFLKKKSLVSETNGALFRSLNTEK